MPATFATIPYELRVEIASYLSWRDFNCFRQIDSRNYTLFNGERIQKLFPLSSLQVAMMTRLGGILTKDPNTSRASKFLHDIFKAAGLSIRYPSMNRAPVRSAYRPRHEVDFMRSDFLGCIHRRNIFGIFETLLDPNTEYTLSTTPRKMNINEVQTEIRQFHEHFTRFTARHRESRGASVDLQQLIELESEFCRAGGVLDKYIEGYSRNTRDRIIAFGVFNWAQEVLKKLKFRRPEDGFRYSLEQATSQLKEIDDLMVMLNGLKKDKPASMSEPTAFSLANLN